MNWLVIDGTGAVVNIVVWDGQAEFRLDSGLALVQQPDGVGIGWVWNGATWIAPTLADPI